MHRRKLYVCSLYELIRGRRRYLDPSLVKIYFWQIMRGLAHMHAKGIFHRDIKPENVLVSDTYDVFTGLKIADYGSCRGIYSKQPFTEYISTRWYRAPECLLTDGYYGAEMDVWGAACVIFEVSALFPLFPGTDERDQIRRIHAVVGTPSAAVLARFKAHANSHIDFNFANEKGSGLLALAPHLDANLADLLTKMLVYDPKARFTAEQALAHPYFDELRSVPVPPELDADASKSSTAHKDASDGGADTGKGDKSDAALAPVASPKADADGATAKASLGIGTAAASSTDGGVKGGPRQSPPGVASALENAVAVASRTQVDKDAGGAKDGADRGAGKAAGSVAPAAPSDSKAIKPSVSAAIAAARKVVAEESKADAAKSATTASTIAASAVRTRAQPVPNASSMPTTGAAPSNAAGTNSSAQQRGRRGSGGKVDSGASASATATDSSKPNGTLGARPKPKGSISGSVEHSGASGTSSKSSHMDPNTFLAGVAVSKLPRVPEGGTPTKDADAPLSLGSKSLRGLADSHTSMGGSSTLAASISAAARELEAAMAQAGESGASSSKKMAPAARAVGPRAVDVLADARAQVKESHDREAAAKVPSGGSSMTASATTSTQPRGLKLAPVASSGADAKAASSIDSDAASNKGNQARGRSLQPLERAKNGMTDEAGGAAASGAALEPRDRTRSKVLQSITLPPRHGAAPAASALTATSYSAAEDHNIIEELLAMGGDRDRAAKPRGLAPISGTKPGAASNTSAAPRGSGLSLMSGPSVSSAVSGTVSSAAPKPRLGPLAR